MAGCPLIAWPYLRRITRLSLLDLSKKLISRHVVKPIGAICIVSLSSNSLEAVVGETMILQVIVLSCHSS